MNDKDELLIIIPAYNEAENIERVKKGTFSALKTCMIWGVFTTLVLLIFPQFIFQIFISEKYVLKTTIIYWIFR